MADETTNPNAPEPPPAGASAAPEPARAEPAAAAPAPEPPAPAPEPPAPSRPRPEPPEPEPPEPEPARTGRPGRAFRVRQVVPVRDRRNPSLRAPAPVAPSPLSPPSPAKVAGRHSRPPAAAGPPSRRPRAALSRLPKVQAVARHRRGRGATALDGSDRPRRDRFPAEPAAGRPGLASEPAAPEAGGASPVAGIASTPTESSAGGPAGQGAGAPEPVVGPVEVQQEEQVVDFTPDPSRPHQGQTADDERPSEAASVQDEPARPRPQPDPVQDDTPSQPLSMQGAESGASRTGGHHGRARIG